MDALTDSVCRALKANPCSLRALAREANVPVSTLSRIVSGKRQATPEVARAIADALDRWASSVTQQAQRVREEIDDE